MLKENRNFRISVSLLISFILFTFLVTKVDVAAVGETSDKVGFSTLNNLVHTFLGVSNTWYTITNVLGIIAILIGLFFAYCGAFQWYKRKNLFKVDPKIIGLGVVYIFIGVVYVFFEVVPINFRPILVNGEIGVSYPSSHTLLTMVCFAADAEFMANKLDVDSTANMVILIVGYTLASVAAVGRLLSGYHWFTDIFGSVLLTGAIIYAFKAFLELLDSKKKI